MNSLAISVEHVSKSYQLGTLGSGTLREDLERWWERRRRSSGRSSTPPPGAEWLSDAEFRALDDVSFEVERGEVLGIIGRNGAGKSTLLKILSRVTAPTRGEIKLWGRVASLLEVGTGFHPELSGRDNIFLNGAILGMTKAEIHRNFDEIVAFSECERFLDTPVKRYSSGMYVRLAFAVAAHLESEILIVDEVLAVGDAAFQRKCLGKMGEVSRHGRTVLFVSHSMSAVATLCSKAVLLRAGRVGIHGSTAAVVAAYQADSASDDSTRTLATMPRQGSGKGRFERIEIRPVDPGGAPISAPYPGCDVIIETRIQCVSAFSDADVAVVLFDPAGGRVIDLHTAQSGEFLSLGAGEYADVRFHVRDLLLRPGIYSVTLWLGRAGIEDIDWVDNATTYNVHTDPVQSKHTEVFPGVYQCRFTHEMSIRGSAKRPLNT